MFALVVVLVTTIILVVAPRGFSKGIFGIPATTGRVAPRVTHDVNNLTVSKLSDTSVQNIRGGQTAQESKEEKFSLSQTLAKNVLGLWGVFQVISILANAIKRLIPIALQPFFQKDMQPIQWGMYAAWCVFMIYNEGYKAFQLKFSPLVVNRAFGISKNPSVLKYIFAGPYSMGLFGADRKRMIVSWSITAGVFSLVKLVKLLPYPYRSIVDSGVVAGLTYGTLSIVFLTVRALLGKQVGNGDQALPLPPPPTSKIK